MATYEQRIPARLAAQSVHASTVRPGMTKPCLEWTGTRSARGYGLIKIHSRTTKAHRVAWTVLHGEVPAGMCVLHWCDNPPCIAGDHLHLGTNDQNMAEMVARERATQGERHPFSKLTAAEALEIRTRARASESRAKLAREFGVAWVAVNKIRDGLHWKSLPREDWEPPAPDTDHCKSGRHRWDEQVPRILNGKRACRLCIYERARRNYQRRTQ